MNASLVASFSGKSSRSLIQGSYSTINYYKRGWYIPRDDGIFLTLDICTFKFNLFNSLSSLIKFNSLSSLTIFSPTTLQNCHF